MDKYTHLKFLDKGSYGRADLYERKTDQVQFVIKTVDPTVMEEKDRAHAYREVDVIKKLDHANIVHYEEWFKKGGDICIVMEYCEAGDLYSRVVNGDALSEPEIWEWFVQICKALEYMHSSKVVHRDLTPKNVFISKDNTLRVGDFGLSRAHTGSTYMMRSKEFIGAIGFNAPEMMEADMKYTDKCDVWAAGCVLYFMIMRVPPFVADGLLAIGRLIEHARYPAIPATVSEELRDTVAWIVQPDPKERPNIAQVLSNDRLQAAVEPDQRLQTVYGVSWANDMLRDGAGDTYKWDHYVNSRDNKARYESFTLYVADALYKRMIELGLKKLPVPLRPRADPDYDNPGTIIFATPDWQSCKHLLVLIHGSGKVKAGEWSRRAMVFSTSVESGTQIPYIRKALQCKYGVIVLNCNDHRQGVDGCTSAEAHGLYVWENYVMESSAVKIAVKSHSDGGPVIAAVYKKFERHFHEKVYANAFTGDDSVPVPVTDYTKKVSRSWISSDKPLGTVLPGNQLECVSAGTPEHIETPHKAFPKVFEFIAERFADGSPGNL